MSEHKKELEKELLKYNKDLVYIDTSWIQFYEGDGYGYCHCQVVVLNKINNEYSLLDMTNEMGWEDYEIYESGDNLNKENYNKIIQEN